MKPTPNQLAPKQRIPSALKATPKQLRYLRILADKTGSTFAYPATIDDASSEITRLKKLPRTDADERTRERRDVQRDLANRPGDATAIRTCDIRGYGSSARWAQSSDNTERPS